MKADPILLQMKYARVVGRFADRCGITLGEALDFSTTLMSTHW